MILATAETAITIVAACIPVLRVFIRNTIQTQPSRDDSQKSQLSRNISGFDLLTPPSPVHIDASKKSGFSFRLNDQTSVPRKTTSKSTENRWLSSASQSHLELQGHEAYQ
jgi:hypothetical protein